MTTVGRAAALGIDTPLVRVAEKSPSAVRILQVFSVVLMVVPGYYVVAAVGADGSAAALISYFMFVVWIAATFFGHHNPFAYNYKIRISLAWMWIVSLGSYLLMDRTLLSSIQRAAADRWLMQLLGMTGIVVMAAEGLRAIEDIRRVLRALTWGGAFCGIVAALQFKARINLAHYLKLPGFKLNSSISTTAVIVHRGAENRVPGTATDPIELGVVAGMVLALAVYLMMHDTSQPKWKRIIPVPCITAAIAASVSRSGLLAATIGSGVLIISLPPARRLKGLAAVPVALAVAFVGSRGLLGTFRNYLLTATSDPSITHRTNNYPYVEQLVRQAPWLGQGGGTYIPSTTASSVHILDNQYLTMAIELGLLGMVALFFYLSWPAIVAFGARRRTANPELRDLCAALAGADLAAMICSATFDGFSFPVFFNLEALIAGLIGAAWMIANKEMKYEGHESGVR
jgi:O-antigen ligase